MIKHSIATLFMDIMGMVSANEAETRFGGYHRDAVTDEARQPSIF